MSRDNPGFDWADPDGLLLRNEGLRTVVHYDWPFRYCRAESSLANQMSLPDGYPCMQYLSDTCIQQLIGFLGSAERSRTGFIVDYRVIIEQL